MILHRSIQFKAAFLLIVFSLNTLVGFACSMGVDMGFNTSHHDDAKSSVHIHKDGKKHVHKPNTAKHHQADNSTASKKDNCCKDKVIKLQTADKSFQYSKTTVNVPVFIVLGNYIQTIIFKTVQPNLKEYTACHFHPPPRDIRIAIRSFQI